MPSDKHPHKHRTYDARARMYIRSQLAWLWGYPVKLGANNLQWQVLYFAEPWEASVLTIDGITLSKSQRAKNRLIKDFPRALPRVVGDVDHWSQLQAVKLSAVKKLLAHQTVDPWQDIIAFVAPNRLLKQGKQLRSDYPALTHVIDAFAWCLSGDIKVLQKALLWLDKNSSSLISINNLYSNSSSNACVNPERLILELFHLEQNVRTKYVQPFIKCIANEDFIHFFTINGGAWGALAQETFKATKKDRIEDTLLIPAQQVQAVFEQISTFVYTLNTRSVAYRRQSLMVFSILVNDTFLAYLRQYFEGVDVIRPLVKKLLFGHQAFDEKELLYEHCERLRKKLRHKYLPALTASSFFSMIDWCVSEDKLVPLLQKQEQLLKHLETNNKNNSWQHPMIMLYWLKYLKSTALPDTISISAFQGLFNQYLADSSSLDQRLKRLHPWSKLVRKSPLNPHDKKPYQVSILSYHEAHFYINEEAATPKFLTRYFQLLRKRCDNSNKSIKNKEARRLFNFLTYSTTTDEPVYDYYQEARKVRPTLKYLYHREYKQLHQAAKGNAKLFGYFYQLWTVPIKPKDDDDIDEFIWDEDRENSITLLAKLAELGYLQSALYLSQQQDYGALKSTAALIQLFIDIKLNLPQPSLFINTEFPDWLSHYPDALNIGLFALLKYHSNPEKAADQLLSSDIPTNKHLQQQIDYLIKQDEATDQPRFNKRIEQLKKRINTPAKVGSTRLKRLDKKLQHAAHTALISHWHQQLETALHTQIQSSLQKLGFSNVEDFEPRYLKTLTALLPLNDKVKTQGYRLLLTHAGHHHWDYYAEPANQQFIQNLEKKGIHTAPWLEKREQEIEKVINEKSTNEESTNEESTNEESTNEESTYKKTYRLRLQLEQDILSLFYMGSHFSTCLSHYDYNFFSVVANIIDINKQVIFAYDDQGKVQGRCLIALTDTGKILNYHYYNHYSGDVFQSMVDDYIDQLATEMKTTRASTGMPAKLIAYDWYDDIANDFRLLSGILEEDSELDEQLGEINPEDFLPTLTKAIAPSKLGVTALELITYMDFFKKRPELSLQLWDKVQRLPNSSRDTRFAFAINLIHIDQHNAAFSLLGKWFVSYAVNKLKYYDWLIEDTLELMLAMSPSLTLRILQKSRSSTSIRNWQDETSAQRLYAAAQAFDQLKRPNLAIELYQLALRNNYWDSLKKEQKEFARERIDYYQKYLHPSSRARSS